LGLLLSLQGMIVGHEPLRLAGRRHLRWE